MRLALCCKAMIKVENLTKKFGGFTAVNNASLDIAKGSITGLIGPNGAGKTTLFNVIAGVYVPSGGKVFLDGEDITGLPPHELFHKGMLRTFQIAHEFSSLTVRENLMMVPGSQAGESLKMFGSTRKKYENKKWMYWPRPMRLLSFLRSSM